MNAPQTPSPDPKIPLPDHIILCAGANVPLRLGDWPHRLALLSPGIAAADLGEVGCWMVGMILIDPDCAHAALNDRAFGEYLTARLPILFYAQRARDLRPIMRRGEAFRARGYVVEMLPP
jgi:hypothetical protein